MNINKKYTIIKPDYSLQSNLMAFGFECDEGWYPMIYELLDKIQAFVDTHPDFADLEIMQIKEKYAGLRVYINYGPDEIYDLINEYENKSYSVCEICGKEGKERERGHWYKTLCEEHYEEWVK